MPHASCLNEKHVCREARWWNGPDHSVMGLMGQRSSETAQDTDHAQSGVSEQKPGVLIHTGETAQITDHTLTPSLPWCHFKTTNKCAKFETFKLFCLSFFFFLGGGGRGHWHVKGFSSKRIALKVDVIGQETTLFTGTSLHLSAWKVYRPGQWRGFAWCTTLHLITSRIIRAHLITACLNNYQPFYSHHTSLKILFFLKNP